MAYAAINLVLQYIFGNLYLGMTVGNITLYALSVICVFKLLKVMVTSKSNVVYTLVTAVYAFSPFIFGLANYNYWDMWVIYLWPIIIYCGVAEKWLLHFVFSFILCFTKEPAVISYGFYCIGLAVIDWIESKQTNIRDKMCKIIKKKKYWAMLALGCSWIYVYYIMPNWNGEGSIAIDGEYVWDKLSVFFLLNFNWLLSLLGIWAVVCIIKKRLYPTFRLLFPILVSDIAFIMFSCLFKTINHARYIDTHASVLLILAMLGILLIEQKEIRFGLAAGTASVLLISCYITYDPLSIAIFKNFNVGNTTMISTSGEFLSDSMVYNQQYRYFDIALNKALEGVVEEENIVLLFPEIGGRKWFFDGNYLVKEENEITTKQYWSKKRQKRVSNIESDYSLITYDISHITEETDLENMLSEDNVGCYFYFQGAGEQLAEKIYGEMDVLSKEDFEFRGWKVTRILFKRKGVL